MSQGTTVGDIRKAIEGLDDNVRVFGKDEQADFMEEFIGFRKRWAPPNFIDGNWYESRDLIDPEFDEEELEEAKENGIELVEVLTVTLSR
jgi:hypothetical protein